MSGTNTPTDGNDSLVATTQSQTVVGGLGEDSIFGLQSGDILTGGVSLTGAGGEVYYADDDGARDYIQAYVGGDTIYAFANDVIDGHNGPDVLYLPTGYTNTGTTANFTIPVEDGSTEVKTAQIWGNGTDTIAVIEIADVRATYTCFAEGTMIATARGEVAVQDLRVGDLVVTAHGGAPLQPVVWLGHSRANVARHPQKAKAAPILIKAGALADGVPHRDLRVSPDHAMFLDGRLVPAKHLVNGTTIVQELWCPEVTYWHVELPAHGLLVSEGAVSESYFDDGNRKHFDNYGITTLFKDFASERSNGRYAEAACYPLLENGEALERIRARLAARAAAVEATRDGARRSA